MANRPFYRQVKFIPIVIGAIIFALFVLNGIYGWIDFETLKPYFTW